MTPGFRLRSYLAITRGGTVPDFVQTAVKEIDDQLRVLKDEASRLEAARASLTGARRRRGRPASNGAGSTPARPASPRNARAAAPSGIAEAVTRAPIRRFRLVREKPGITIPEIAEAMKIEPNYLPGPAAVASDGQVKRDGQGWHQAASSTSAHLQSPFTTFPRNRWTRATKSKPGRHPVTAPGLAGPASQHRRRTAALPVRPRRRSSRRSPSGEAMTVGQVDAKVGLARRPSRPRCPGWPDPRGREGRAWSPADLRGVGGSRTHQSARGAR